MLCLQRTGGTDRETGEEKDTGCEWWGSLFMDLNIFLFLFPWGLLPLDGPTQSTLLPFTHKPFLFGCMLIYDFPISRRCELFHTLFKP